MHSPFDYIPMIKLPEYVSPNSKSLNNKLN